MINKLVCFAMVLSFTLALNDATRPVFGDGPCQPCVIPWYEKLPVYDHIVIVVEENKDYEEIIKDKPIATYINQVLRPEGANLTQMYGEEHNSQGNYFWLFSGSNQDVGFVDQVPGTPENPQPFTSSNLAQQLILKGKTFKGYSEGLPEIGSTCNSSPDGLYARKHVPWVSFSNVPNGKTVKDSCNLRFEDFPKDFSQLPTVSFVIPNLINDMHNGPSETSIPTGDKWLKEHIDPYYQWAKTHNSLLILTFDENNDRRQFLGLTTPQLQNPRGEFEHDIKNQIVTIFAGAHINPGDYTEGKGITHVNVLRTIESMYGLPKSGKQQPNASGSGITDDYIITDVFAQKDAAPK